MSWHLSIYTITVINNNEIKQGEIVVDRSSTVAVFIPYSPFLPDTPVDVTLTSKVTDIAGNSIAGSGGPGTDLVFSFNAATNADYMPPRVLSISPPDGVAGLNPNTSISATFTEPVNPVTVNSDSFLVSSEGENHAGRILLSKRNTIATFIPARTLPLSRQITVTLTTDITDVSGNPMVSTFRSSFITASGTDNFQPMVVSVSPGSGARNMPLNTMVQVVFSERVDPLTVDEGTFYLTYPGLEYGTKVLKGRVRLSEDGKVATLTPERPLLPNTDYRVYVTRGITDIAGNPLYEKYNGTFRTGETLRDDTAPGVLNVSPETGTTGVALNAEVVLEFTEVVAGTTISGQTVVVSAGGVPVPGETSLSPTSWVFTAKGCKTGNLLI